MTESPHRNTMRYFAILGIAGCLVWICRDPKNVEPYVATVGAIAGLISLFFPSADVSIGIRMLNSPAKKGYWVIENLGGAVAYGVTFEVVTVQNIATFYFAKDWSPYDNTAHKELFPIASLGPGEQQLLPLQPNLDWPQDGHLFDVTIRWSITPKGKVIERKRRMAFYDPNRTLA